MPLMVKTSLKSLGKIQQMMLAEGSKEKTQDFILTDIAPTKRRHPLPMEQSREANPHRIHSSLEMPRGNEAKVSKDST